MYFDAINLLTNEQLKQCEKEKISRFPEDVNYSLCRLCKVLTEDQMKQVSAYCYQIKWPHKTLFDWHLKHLQDDEKINHKEEEK